LTKVKDNPASVFLEMKLKVPRGLWLFLENLQRVGGPDPREHLETLLTKELEALLDELPDDTFDLNFLRERFGEGSDIYKPKDET
jgi:hypothetical protein